MYSRLFHNLLESLIIMEFVHQTYYPGETIAAIATPPGEGGVAIIRISGDEALACASRVFSGPVHQYKSHTAHFGQITNAIGEHLDDVLLLVMLGNALIQERQLLKSIAMEEASSPAVCWKLF